MSPNTGVSRANYGYRTCPKMYIMTVTKFGDDWIIRIFYVYE